MNDQPMNQGELINFVSDLCDSIKVGMINKIAKGKIPTNWDGRELRWWIADTFEEKANMGGRPKRGQDHANLLRRYHSYQNDIIINDL